jgi:hypothetical protein
MRRPAAVTALLLVLQGAWGGYNARCNCERHRPTRRLSKHDKEQLGAGEVSFGNATPSVPRADLPTNFDWADVAGVSKIFQLIIAISPICVPILPCSVVLTQDLSLDTPHPVICCAASVPLCIAQMTRFLGCMLIRVHLPFSCLCASLLRRTTSSLRGTSTSLLTVAAATHTAL